MRRLLLPVLVFAAAAHAEPRRFALVVGSNEGDEVRAAPLRYADDDAVSMHELLLEAGVESVLLVATDDDTARLHPLTAAVGEPTHARLLQALDAQRQKMREARARGEEVEWTFFFSGHGDVEGGEGFLALAKGRLTRTELHEAVLARVEAHRVHVIIDACKSAWLVAGKGPGGRRVPFPYAFAAEPQRAANVGFFLSASASRDSHEWARLQAGVFSYEVRSGLRGAADADGDGRISYAELGAFLRTANVGIPNPEYRPDFTVLPPRGADGFSQPVLAWPRADPLIVDVAPGHLTVERATGERLLDVHAAEGFQARLFLPADRPLFVRSDDGATERTLHDTTPRLSSVPTAPGSTLRKGALHLAFARLFAEPFDARAVERWQHEWRAPDFTSLEAGARPTFLEQLRPVAGWLALGSAAVGAVGLSLAWLSQDGAGALSQRERVERNQQIVALNVVGVTGLVVSAAALTTWVTLSLLPGRAVSVALAPGPGGGAFVLSGSWP